MRFKPFQGVKIQNFLWRVGPNHGGASYDSHVSESVYRAAPLYKV